MRKLLGVLYMLLIAGAGYAQAPHFAQKLDSFMDALDCNQKSMCAVAVFKGGTAIYNRAIGYANTGKHLKADTATRYKIGSVSKMFTATIIFQLIDEKKLAPDTKLSTFFPQVPNATDITIAQMLSHHSGIGDLSQDTTYDNWSGTTQTRAAMLKRIAAYKPAFPPGEKAEYSNVNYILLGYIIEQVTGSSYHDVLAARITRPLHLTHTANGDDAIAMNALAASYTFDGEEWTTEPNTDASVSHGAGAVLSNPADLNRFITALMQGRLISGASLALMTTIKDHYGMGIFQVPFGQRKGFGHSGRIDGFTSTLGYFPQDSVAFSVVVNGQNFSENDIALAALSAYYGLPVETPNSSNVVLAATELKAYEGEYSSDKVPLKINVTTNGKALFAQATGQGVLPLQAESKSSFSFKRAGLILDFPVAGKMILHQGGADITFTRK